MNIKVTQVHVNKALALRDKHSGADMAMSALYRDKFINGPPMDLVKETSGIFHCSVMTALAAVCLAAGIEYTPSVFKMEEMQGVTPHSENITIVTQFQNGRAVGTDMVILNAAELILIHRRTGQRIKILIDKEN